MNINKVALQHNKEFIMFIFLFIGFITMCNLKKRLVGVVLSTPASDVHERLKTNSTAIKIDLVTVFDAILTSRQAREKLQ